MKRILAVLCGILLSAYALAACSSGGDGGRKVPVETASVGRTVESYSADEGAGSGARETDGRQIRVTAEGGGELVFRLNDSPAAAALFSQLPLSLRVEDYAENEKIFYPPEKLDTDGAPLARGPAGTLAYYAPWGNVAIFYGECGGADGLYGLGEAVLGAEGIGRLSGEIQITDASAPQPEPEKPESPASPPARAEEGGAGTSSATSEETPLPRDLAGEESAEEVSAMKMNVQIGEAVFSAVLEENAAAASLVERMRETPVAVPMSDYSGFEKVGALGAELPADDSRITARAGDIVLYGGNQIVLFYGSNTWSYTRLGRIEDLSGWEEALGGGGITAVFSLE